MSHLPTDSPTDAGSVCIIDAAGESLRMAWCPAGSFVMGTEHPRASDPPEEIPHPVTLTHGFWIATTPITTRLWDRIMEDELSSAEASDQVPVYGMSWITANLFCRKLSVTAGQPFALPTEAQWEYACRAGTSTRWYFGDDSRALRDHAWYRVNSGDRSHPVGLKSPNPWGLYDVYGAVAEWCVDAFAPYPSTPSIDPLVRNDSNLRILRGGSFIEQPDGCRSARRTTALEDETNLRVNGIRVVVNITNAMQTGPSDHHPIED